MEQLPPELRARRQDIYDTVTNRGRNRRRRRAAALVVIVAAVIAIPVGAVALVAHDDGHVRVVSSVPESTYNVHFTVEGDICGARPSAASASTQVAVGGALPTTTT